MRKIVSCAVGVLLAGCAKQKPASEPAANEQRPEAASAAGGKPDFDALAAREATGLSEQRVTGPNKSFTATVRASAPPKVSLDGNVAIVEIPIGSGGPMRCQVFSEVLDAGGTVSAVLADAAKRVELQQVAPWAIEVVNEVPTSFVHAIYTMQTPRGKAAGEVKLAVHAPADSPVLCLHDEMGYEKTPSKRCRVVRAADPPVVAARCTRQCAFASLDRQGLRCSAAISPGRDRPS